MKPPYRFGRRTPPSERRPVAWFAPSTLLHAAQELVASQDFLRNFDRRETFAVNGRVRLEIIDRSRQQDDENFFFDFIADTGDGGAATYAVAQAALRRELEVAGSAGRTLWLPEGELLILGGDLAYPGASPQDYQYRLLEMFEWARDPRSRFQRVGADQSAEAGGPHKYVAAIPQNHDWFDSAATFCRYFVNHDKGVFIGARTPQAQSYFAARLPHEWWVLGFDWALSGDLDRYQFEAFAELARAHLGANSDLILIYPEPYWTRPLGDGAPEGYPKRYQRLEALLEHTGARIRLRLAGDLHLYHRESLARDGANGLDTHLVICGSGGAFTHPTHSVDIQGGKVLDREQALDVISDDLRHQTRVGRIDGSVATPASRFTAKCTYPAPGITRCMALRSLWWSMFRVRLSRPWREQDVTNLVLELLDSNLGFALALGALYGINAYVNSFVFSASFAEDGFNAMADLGFWQAAPLWLNAMVFSPFATGVNLIMLAGCVKMAWEGPGPRWTRLFTGLVHGMLHGFVIFALYWSATHLLQLWGSDNSSSSLLGGLISWAMVAAAGAVAGALIFGLYLTVANSVFGQLPNNAFGALANANWKGFLRFRLSRAGLQVSMIGLDQIAERAGQPDAQAGHCRIVDDFFVAKPAAGEAPPQA